MLMICVKYELSGFWKMVLDEFVPCCQCPCMQHSQEVLTIEYYLVVVVEIKVVFVVSNMREILQ